MRTLNPRLEEWNEYFERVKHTRHRNSELENLTESFPTDFERFNEEVIGRPVLPSTNQPNRLMRHQVDIATYAGHYEIVNKSNKIGVTEAFLREGVWRGVVGDCRTYDLMLGSSELPLSHENMRRLTALFLNSDKLRPLVKEALVTRLVLYDGTRYVPMPSDPIALRSWPRVKWEFLDEAAHHGVLDDSEYFAAASSRLANTNGWQRITSTPRGQRGMFYDYSTRAMAGKLRMKYVELPYQIGLGSFFNEEFIDEERERLGALFEQEYECKFLTAQNAAIESALVDSAVTDGSTEEW